MVNKKLKKKTKWHPLSLAAGTKNGEEGKVDDAKSTSIPFKMEWKINHNGENNYYRNNLSSSNANSASHHNNNNHPHQQRFDKRASKSYSKSHHTNGYSSSSNNTTGGNSDNKFGKQEHQSHKDFPKKVQFNEDEYTRITTPRQDVLFKKGYLSRPKTQPVTPTHQPYNNVPVDGFYPGTYITADSPPLAINGALTPPNGADYPFIPGHGAFMNDGLNNVYGNPVFFMPYHQDIFYPPSDLEIGDTYNMYNNNLYSPPLIEEHDGSVSQPVTSATSTNCSDESESSEEVVTTATEPTEASTEIPARENEIKTEQSPEETSVDKTIDEQETQKVEENTEEVVTNVSPGCFENGYDSINPYLNPYSTPVYYYPMPFYPVPPMGPYSPNEFYQNPDPEFVAGVNGFGVENGRYNKYPKRKKRYRKTLSSSGTSITDYSEDESMGQHETMTNSGSGDSGFTDATKNELATEKHPECTSELSINETIAHQSTLNVEVPEFRPKQSQPITNGFYNTYNNKHNYYNKKTWHHSNRETTREKYPSTQLVEERKQTKSNISVRKPLVDKKLQSSETPVVVENTVNTVNNGNSTKPSIKKRPTNPVLEKKILIESTKNIEMQNIDFMKSKIETLARNDVRIETTWVVVGGKRKMIQEEIPIEREKSKEETTKNEPETNSIDVSPTLPIVTSVTTTTNNAQTKKPSRKAKQKNKPQHKRNAQQGKNTKLQGFVIEEPTFTSVEQKIEVNGDNDESDSDELLEAALIETIPWTEADVKDVNSDEKLSDLSEASSASTSIIVNNMEINETEHEQTTDCSQNDQKQEKTCDEETMCEENLDQTKAEVLEVEEIEDDMNCSRSDRDEVVVPEEKSETYFQKTDKTIEIVESLIIAEEKSSPKLANGISNHIVVENAKIETETAVEEEICAKLNHVTLEKSPKKIEIWQEEISDAAILEINEPPKYSLTTVVQKWINTFNNNDLQSLFTIPLSPDFVEKMKHCPEISQYFADDDLQRLDMFINDNFRYDSHMSAASSISSLLSDITDDEDEDDTSQNARSTHKKALKKYFGCEIM